MMKSTLIFVISKAMKAFDCIYYSTDFTIIVVIIDRLLNYNLDFVDESTNVTAAAANAIVFRSLTFAAESI
jgi:hypothetical protein